MVAACALPACNCGENNGQNNGPQTNNETNNPPGGEAGVTVSPTQLQTTEAGGTATFTVVLDSEPGGEVTVSLASTNEAEGTVDPTTLTFDEGNWDTAQEVTVTGVDDDVADGNQDYLIETTVASDDDDDYDGIEAADVEVTNVDDDMATISVMPTSVTVNENGTTATVDVTIGAMPSDDVVISVTPADDTQLTVDVTELTFTEANETQTFTITAVDDELVEQNPHVSTIALGVSSGDEAYAAIDPTDIDVSIIDNDTSEIAVNPTALTLRESGAMTTGTFTISLGAAPTSDVTIDLSSSDTSEATVSPAQVTLNAGTTEVEVTVTAVDDTEVDGAQTITIVTGATVSDDTAYDGVELADVVVTVLDDDTANINVTPTTLTVNEENETQETFSVSLSAAPAAEVIVEIAPSSTDVTLSDTSLTFDSTNWQMAQDVTVTAVDDDEAEGNETVVLNITVNTQDPAYTGVNPDNVIVTVLDNELAGVSVTPQAVTVSETGTTATVEVNIGSAPTADVTIDFTSSDPTEATVSPATHTFTAGAAPAPVTITITGVDDDEADGPTQVSIITDLTTTAAEYASATVPDVSVTVLDDDQVGFNVSPTTLSILEGSTANATIALTSAPTSPVTIDIVSGDPANATVSPTQLVFDDTNWSTGQNLTFTAVDDAIDDGAQLVIFSTTASSADAAWDGANVPDIAVTAQDNDTAGFAVVTGDTITNESGKTITFTVSLTAAPADDVAIQAFSSDPSEGVVTSPAGGNLLFDALNWETGIDVTVTGQDDALQDGAVNYQVLFNPAVSNDAAYDGQSINPVNLINQDNEAGFTILDAPVQVSESGTTDTFRVVLNAEPQQNVRMLLKGDTNDVDEGGDEYSFGPKEIIFTPDNWSTPVTVTVTGEDDAILGDNVDWQITVSVGATTADPAYANACAASALGCPPQTVQGTTLDDDVASVQITPTTLPLNEGQCNNVTATLATPPAGTVSFDVTTPDTDQVRLNTLGNTSDTATYTFQVSGGIYSAQFTVCGTNDNLPEVDQNFTLVTTNLVSTDTAEDYHDLPLDDITVQLTDDDAAQIVVNVTEPGNPWPVRKRMTYETGAPTDFDEFSVGLTTPNTASVVVTVTSSDPSEALVSTGSSTPAASLVLSFNYIAGVVPPAETVRIHGVDDAQPDGSQDFQITFSVSSADMFYDGLQVTPLDGVNIDDDRAGFTFLADTQPFRVTEGGGTDAFRVFTNTSPTANVVVDVEIDDPSQGRFSYMQATNTTFNWLAGCTAPCLRADNPEGVMGVVAVDDSLDDGDQPFNIEVVSKTTTDPDYDSVPFPAVHAIAVDNDGAGVQYCLDSACNNPITSINIDEDDTSVTVYARLTSQPGGTMDPEVTLDFASSDTGEFTITNGSSLTWDDTDWANGKAITIDGTIDNLDDGDQTVQLTAAAGAGTNDPAYNAASFNSLSVVVEDIDGKEILFDGVAYSSGTDLPDVNVSEPAEDDTINVALSSIPDSPVTINVYTFDDTIATVSPAQVVLDDTNWQDGVDVTITAVDDLIDNAGNLRSTEVLFDIATSADPDFDGIGPFPVDVNVSDDDGAGVQIIQPSDPPFLVVDEHGSQASFQVVLLTQPAPNSVVVVEFGASESGNQCVQTWEGGGTSCDRGHVTPSVTFDDTNWNQAQTVTVTGQNDAGTDTLQWFVVNATIDESATDHDPAYDNAAIGPIDSVLGVNVDNDDEAIVVFALPHVTQGGLALDQAVVTSESGQQGTLWARLTDLPTDQVTLHVSISDPDQATHPASIVIDSSNYRGANAITFTGLDANDTLQTGAPYGFNPFTITLDAESNDPNYDGLQVDVNGYNADNDMCQVAILPANTSNVSRAVIAGEEPHLSPFIVTLTANANQQVNLSVTSDDTSVAEVVNGKFTRSTGGNARVVWSRTVGTGEVDFTAVPSTADTCYLPASNRTLQAETDGPT